MKANDDGRSNTGTGADRRRASWEKFKRWIQKRRDIIQDAIECLKELGV